MTKKRLEFVLLIIVSIEVAAAAALIVWAVFFHHKDTAKPAPAPVAQTTSQTPAPSLHVPTLLPVQFATGLTRPTAIASSDDRSDHRLFVTEQQGTIRTIDNVGKVAGQSFLDIQSKVQNDKAEMGLLGLALHPGFKQSGYFYVDYVDKAQETIIARYQVSKQTGLADPASEKVLLKIKQPYPNHKGGQLAFGPDGYLYIGMGDGGSGGDPENRAQNKGELLGKILRIDVDHGDPYAIPASNPFKNEAGAKPEIWAYGLRNPWRFSFDTQTKDLFIADVGQSAYEELDIQPSTSKGGENYGWRCYEATHAYNTDGCKSASNYVAPVLEYAHGGKGGACSITGGYVYRGSRFPSLAGKYVFGDYCTGQIFYAENTAGKWQSTLGATTQFTQALSTFGQDNQGELYVADLAGGGIYHLTDSAQH
ncbi:MAG TPA: PQQ-dependent sugar dehydrogenase [Candidatus Saccharimonadales bacterium]